MSSRLSESEICEFEFSSSSNPLLERRTPQNEGLSYGDGSRSRSEIFYHDAEQNRDWQQEVAALFAELRPDIKKMITRHLDRRLLRRVDPSDIVQSAYLDVQDRLTRFLRERPMEIHRWLFFLAKMKTLETNKHHLRSKKRALGKEAELSSPAVAHADVTSPSQALSRKETKQRLKSAISELPDHYQQVIELRHLEGLNNHETSRMLDLTENAASKLYVRALNALQKKLAEGTL